MDRIFSLNAAGYARSMVIAGFCCISLGALVTNLYLKYQKLNRSRQLVLEQAPIYESAKDKTLRIVCLSFNEGLGDKVFCLKMAQVLKRIFPYYNVVLHGKEPRETMELKEQMLRRPELGTYDVERLPWDFLSPLFPQLKTVLQNSLFIYGPLLETRNNKSLSIASNPPLPPKDLQPLTNIWSIGEYSADPIDPDSELAPFFQGNSGLGKDELGIFISPIWNTPNQIFESRFLQKISQKFPGVKPYAGYCQTHRMAAFFTAACIFKEAKKNENIHICLSAPNLFSFGEDEMPLKPGELPPFIKLLSNLEISRKIDLVYVIPDDNSQAPRYFRYNISMPGLFIETYLDPEKDLNKKRVYLYLTKDHVSSGDMQKLLCESPDSFTLATGDQTLSEVVSNGCVFAYDLRPHKHHLFGHLIKIAYEADLKLLSEWFLASSFSEFFNDEAESTLARFMSKLDFNELKLQANKLSEIIRNNYNIESFTRKLAKDLDF